MKETRKKIDLIPYTFISAFLLIFIIKGSFIAWVIMIILNILFWYGQLRSWVK